MDMRKLVGNEQLVAIKSKEADLKAKIAGARKTVGFRTKAKIRLHDRGDGTCGLPSRTLARESRHIVASLLSGTTSRAAVLIPRVSSVWRRRSGALTAFGEGGRIPRDSNKGFCLQGFFADLASRRRARRAGAMRRGRER